MKLLKLLFSRGAIIALAIIVQLLLPIVVYFTINNDIFDAIFTLVCDVLAVIAVFIIMKKKQFAEYKLPWLFLFIVFPLLGIILYAMFGNKKLSRKQRKMQRLALKSINISKPESDTEEQLKDCFGDDYSVSKYLETVTGHKAHLNNRTTYFSCGEDFFNDFNEQLKKATKFIFLEYFIIGKGKIWDEILKTLVKKANEGVEVRILYDDIGSLGRISVNFPRQMKNLSIHCVKFNPFLPIPSRMHNNRDHRKITVIDGKVAYTGGINIGDEYANIKSPYGYWKDVAIKVEGSAVVDFTCLFLQMYDGAKNKLSHYHRYLATDYEVFEDEGAVQVFGDSPKPFDDEMIGENNFLNLINNAKKSIFIATPYLIIDYTLTTALRNASLRGVDVTIITPHIPDKKIIFWITRSHYRHLMDAGIKIYEYTPGFMHAKTVLVDDKLAFIGTINFDYRSLAHHFECGAILYKSPCIMDIKKDFENSIAVSEKVDSSTFKMSKFTRLINTMLSAFFSLF